MKVLLDTNVVVDVLQGRDPWCEPGKKIFLAAAHKEIIGCITAKEATDIHYFSRKQFKGEDNVDEKARQILTKLFSLFDVIDTLEADCKNAMAISNNDYEDAVMIACAMREGIDCIVTRNAEHFKMSPIKIYTPDEFVGYLGSQKQENKKA